MPHDINPIIVTTTKTITSFEIIEVIVQLDVNAKLHVYLKNGDEILYAENILLTGADYDNWGSDDSYIVNFITNYITTKYNGQTEG